MAKPVEQLDQVMIRFAGDSGDGMQLTGGRFTSETGRCSATTSRRCPTSPPRSARRQARSPGVSGFQVHFADHDILTPGDAPNVLVAMNPAALKTNLKDLPKGGTLIVNNDAFTRAQPREGRLHGQPARGRLARRVPACTRVPLTSLTIEALKEFDVTKREAERSKNMFALGLMSWLYDRPTEGTIAFLEKKFASEAGRSPTRTSRRSRPATRTARRPRTSPSPTRSSRRSSRPAPTGTSPATRRSRMGLIAASVQSGLPLVPRRVSDHAGLGDPRGALARYKHFGVRTFQAEDEIAAVGAALGAAFGGALGVSTSSGPGVVLKSETIGLAVTLELPLLILDIQRAGPSHGHADEAGAGRPADGAVRPERRVARAGGRGRDARRLLRAGDRGRADRAQVPHAGLPALRRVPRERLRAVADPGRRLASRTSRPTSRPSRTHDGPFLPYLRDAETLARPWAIPGHARARAPDRRAREGRTAPATSPTTRTTTTRWSGSRAQGRRDRGRHPRARGGRPGRARSCSCSAGAGRTARSPRPSGASAATAARSRTRTSAT